jgi:hypothetical protein
LFAFGEPRWLNPRDCIISLDASLPFSFVANNRSNEFPHRDLTVIYLLWMKIFANHTNRVQVLAIQFHEGVPAI